MAYYFQLFRKLPNGETENDATSLSQIDREICEEFDLPLHPKLYVNGWFDVIGFGLATGKTWDDIRANTNKQIASTEAFDLECRESDLLTLRIVDFLEARFSPNCWFGRGK